MTDYLTLFGAMLASAFVALVIFDIYAYLRDISR